MIDRSGAITELQSKFNDLLNYDAEDILEPIDPITYCTPEGDSCLHLACIRGDFRSVSLLIELGVDVNSRGDLRNTPLHYATAHGHGDIAALLVKNGADTTCENELGKIPGERKVRGE